MGRMKIRPYAPRDLGHVLEIWEAASRTGHPFLSESFIAAERERVRDVYLRMATTWLCEDDGRVVGFISLVDNEVGALFVEPKSHRRGIGRALMEIAMGRSPTLELEVFKENSTARAFYERCGFDEISEYRHAETGRQMLRMRYAIPQAGELESDGDHRPRS